MYRMDRNGSSMTIAHVQTDLGEDHTAAAHVPARVFRCFDP